MKKKVLFCSYNLDVGGIEKSLVNLVNNLSNNFDVTILLEKKEGLFLNQLNKNIIVKEFKVFNNKNLILRKFLNMMNKLIFTIKNYHRYDCSFCYATYNLSSNILSRIASNNSVFMIHSNYYEYFNRNEKLFNDFYKKRNVDKFKHIICVSNEIKKDFINHYMAKAIYVVNNLVNVNEILDKSTYKIEYVPKYKYKFCFVGRIDNSSKNLELLIESFNKVSIDYELNIIGDGPDFKRINNLINKYNLNDRVHMMGKKENPYPYMKMSDYIILTSYYEGFPVIYSESIILGKQVLSTIDVSDEYISFKDFGYLLNNDSNEIAKFINTIPKKKKYNIDYNILNKKRLEKIINIIDGEV